MKSGIFAQYAHKYNELGINVIPTQGKQPFGGCKWNQWQKEKQTAADIDRMVQKFGDAPGIAVICGEVSGLVGFDFDYKFKKNEVGDFGLDEEAFRADMRTVLNLVDRVIKPYEVSKVGEAGFTAFFKWTDGMHPVACDRNGVRCFDFKANGYIVVPPSWHSNSGPSPIFYKWIIGDLISDFHDLTQLDFGKVLDLKEHLSIVKPGSKMQASRHGTLFLAGLNFFELGATKDVVAKRMVELDQKYHGNDPKGPYLSSSHCARFKTPLEAAEHWVERIYTFFINKKSGSKGSNKNVQPNSDGWQFFIESPFQSVRRDLVSGIVKARLKEKSPWFSIQSFESTLKIEARKLGVPPGQVAEQVDDYCKRHEGQDFLCDIPKWDGVERMRPYCDRLQCTDFSGDEFFEIFKRWATLMFARAFDSSIQNEFLIFTGKQGIGKDTWLDDLFNAFVPYYGTPMIGRDAKEFSDAVSRLLVAKVPEFERTETLSIAELKNVITTSSAFFRRPYAEAAEWHKISCSFIGSSNSLDLMRDSTGNRRFVVIELDGIVKAKRIDKEESLQLIAEIKEWYQTKQIKPWSANLTEKIREKMNLLAPPDLEYEVACLLAKRLKDRLGPFDKVSRADPRVTEVILGVASEYHPSVMSERKIRVIANTNFGGQGRIEGEFKKVYLSFRLHKFLQTDMNYMN